MERLRRSRVRLGVAATAICTVGSGAAVAVAASQVKAHKMTRSHGSAMTLARSITRRPQLIRDAFFLASPPKGSARVVVQAPHEAVYGFPRGSGEFAVLSDGCGMRFDKPKYKGSSGCNDLGPKFRGTRDTTIFGVALNVPKGASCLSFRFRFLSNEYPKWVGQQYNDAFIAELDRSTWSSPKNAPGINAPRDFAKTPDGSIISINATGVGHVSPANARGTGYDAATRILRASTPIKPGRHTLFLSIFDQGDRQYDSAVFVDRLTVNHRSPCTRGVAFDQH